MTRQVQDAYIVAATRTPIGKAPKGMYRNTRPDDLLVAVIRSALKQVPSLDPGCDRRRDHRLRDAGGRAGLERRAHRSAAGRFAEHDRRRDDQPLLLLGLNAVAMAADRIRVGEADVMIAGGTESMSMVPMTGNKPAFNARSSRRMRISASRTAWGSPPRRSQRNGR
jgi:acetyl-CoA acyltransferase